MSESGNGYEGLGEGYAVVVLDTSPSRAPSSPHLLPVTSSPSKLCTRDSSHTTVADEVGGSTGSALSHDTPLSGWHSVTGAAVP